MDGEMFTNEPVWGGDAAADMADKKYRVVATSRRVLQVLLVLLVILCVYYGFAVFDRLQEKANPTTKEGLQYIGPRMNSVRGDLENNQDSLAETAIKEQRRMTNMAPQAFTARERMTTPEEELLKKMNE